VARLLPGALGDEDGARDDSHASGLLEYPHYTRPPEFRGWPAPEILLSGNHAQVAKWRRFQSIRRTWERRPDLLARVELTAEERRLVKEWESVKATSSDSP
jgi:tRNA (guanine37-N1)-methyltransferase